MSGAEEHRFELDVNDDQFCRRCGLPRVDHQAMPRAGEIEPDEELRRARAWLADAEADYQAARECVERLEAERDQ